MPPTATFDASAYAGSRYGLELQDLRQHIVALIEQLIDRETSPCKKLDFNETTHAGMSAMRKLAHSR